MKYIYILISFLFPLICFGQGINNLWLMGYPGGGGGINFDFSGGVLNIIQDRNRKMDFEETNGEICNMNGNLLFYTNGVYIANASGDTMPTGGGLNPSYYPSSYASINYGLTRPQAN